MTLLNPTFDDSWVGQLYDDVRSGFGEERFANSAWWGVESTYEQVSNSGGVVLTFTERYWIAPW